MVVQEEVLQKKTINVKGVGANAWARFRAQVVKENRNTAEVLGDAMDAYVEEKEAELVFS